MKIDLVVTKNPSFLAYLIKEGIVESAVPWYEHGTPAAIFGKHVLGDDLPYCLACIAMSYIEIPLHLPKEMVGKKLMMADYEKYADVPVVYTVKCLPRTEMKSVKDTPTPFKPWMLAMEVS